MRFLWFNADSVRRGCGFDALPARVPAERPRERRRPPTAVERELGLAGFFADTMRLPRGPRLFMPDGPACGDAGMDLINILPFRTVGMGPDPVRKALRLLARVSTPAQRHDLSVYGQFVVHAPGYGKYMILPRSVFNVVELESGVSYCAGPLMALPIPDLMLMQKLLLENEPEYFFQIANRRPADLAMALHMRA